MNVDWKAQAEKAQAELDQAKREIADLRINPSKGERDLEMRICAMETALATALGYPDPSDIEAATWDGMLEDVCRLAVPRRDPADDAAWPLPEGWRWGPLNWPSLSAWRDNSSAWVSLRGFSASTIVPLDVIDVLRARWEAGQG